jgi:DNA-binding IclR family transcriptional regulator
MRSSSQSTVLDRAFGILESFVTVDGPLSLTEISRRSGLALSTTHRLVAQLTERGALERDEHGLYHVGLRLWEVAARAHRGLSLRDAALPFLEDLYEATHQNVQLAVLDGTDAVYVERISGHNAVHTVTRVGGRLPLHATGVGLVLLAYAPLALRQQVLAGPLKRYTKHTLTDPAILRRTLADIRRHGYAISYRQVELVSLSVAAPVIGVQGQVVAGLSVVVPARSEPRSYVPAVVTAARGISRVLHSRSALGADTTLPGR